MAVAGRIRGRSLTEVCVEELAAWATRLITAHAGWAPLVIGLLCFGESLVLIGLFIPATSLMIATGSLLATGRLEALPVLAAAVVGAALGDWVSYLIGDALGPAAYRHWPLREHRTAVAQARLFFRRFGFATVFGGRFLGPLRAVVPLVAGVTRMPVHTFQMANLISAILWVPLLFAPGYLSARHLVARGGMNEGSLILVGFGIGIGFAIASWFVSRAMSARRRRRKALRA
ncbi:DedA family protein [Sphingomonas sp. AP4-R1]|uniref:DedA family protein n=1 Tax=Sphingomonas sp. AP4-R1 TaxID=2735134 RepID=UPI001493C7C2|nr:DedA family protein [Sphingomonas sp. AP4-R1]QJU58194.1 DedA family protein [Sphingomonas sp. AP4-R1]